MPDTTTERSSAGGEHLSFFLGARREPRLVAMLTGTRGFGDEYKSLINHPRVADLPGMLRRHGLLQTMMFLGSKTDNDKQLLKLLKAAVKEYAGHALPSPASLAEEPLEALRLQAQAIEAAVWIRQVAAAHEVLKEPTNGTPDAEQDTARTDTNDDKTEEEAGA